MRLTKHTPALRAWCLIANPVCSVPTLQGYEVNVHMTTAYKIMSNPPSPRNRSLNRLVRYYRIAGFRAIREVGEDLGSLKDRLLWGAEGTLMAAKVEDFMERWTRVLLKDSNSDSDSSAREAVGASAESLTSS